MGPALAFFRDAAWFDARRARDYPRLIALCFLPMLAFGWFLALQGRGTADFAAFWAAGRLAWDHPLLAWDFDHVRALEAGLYPPGRWTPFVNPPPFLLFVAPFGLLPFAAGLIAWVLITLALYGAACRPLANLWWAAAFPPVLLNAVGGQNGLLTGALFIGAVTQLERRPFLAGALFGCLVIKPQLALLVPLALLAGRQWRAIVGAAASSLGLTLLSLAVFGAGALKAFLAASVISRAVLASGVHALQMQTVLALFDRLGASQTLAWSAQGAVTAAVATLVVLGWRGAESPVAKAALLAAATPLASPYLYTYDLPLMLLPLAWLAREGAARGALPWERLVMAVSFALPLAADPLARVIGFNPGPLAHLALTLAVWRRLTLARAESRTSAAAPEPLRA